MEFARAGRPTMMPMSGSLGGGGARAQRATGSSTTMAEFCSTETGRVASLAPGSARQISGIWPRSPLSSSIRAREARRHDSGRAAGAGDARRRRFLLRFRFDDGVVARGDDDDADIALGLAALERSELRGHRQRWPNSAALTLVGWPRSLKARLGRSAEFGRVHHSLHRYARARRAATTGNKAVANQSPLLKPCLRRVHSKERLRVSNWMVQKLYDYAVNKNRRTQIAGGL